MILIEELQKYPALLSDKIDKYEYSTGEEILPPDQRRVIEKVKFTYSPLRKGLVKEKEQWKIKEKSNKSK